MAEPGLAPAAAKAKNEELRTDWLADHGLKLYSNGIVATEGYLSQERRCHEALRPRQSALFGWQFALRNPEKAAADQIKFVPSLDINVQVRASPPKWAS